MLGTTLGDLEGILLGKSDRIELGFSGYWETRCIAKSIPELNKFTVVVGLPLIFSTIY